MEPFIIIVTLVTVAFTNILLKQRKIIEFLSVFASLIGFGESFLIAIKVSSIGSYSPWWFFSIDSLGAITMLIIGFIGFVSMVYSVAYLRQETLKKIIGFTRVKQYFVLLNIFIAAMFLAIMASSPIFAWISIEATTLSTAFLISFYNKPSSAEGAWKYLIINSVGLLLGFLGTLLYFTAIKSMHEGGFISWNELNANATQIDPLIAKIAFIFVLIGYGTKIGFAPMHTWKPDAYSKAPAPVGALLSGALLPLAFVILLRFKVITDLAVKDSFTQNLLIDFGLLSVTVAALIILSTKNYKRLLAYSSIENAGIMALGFGFGSIVTTMIYLIYHSVIKSALFFLSGNLLLKYGSAKIHNIKGALHTIPFTSMLFIFSFLVITGMPPFGIFLAKIGILSTGIKSHPFASVTALFLTAMVFIGFLKSIMAMFFGEKPNDIKIGETHIWLIIPPTFLIIVMICLSFYLPPFLQSLINNVSL